MTTTPTVDQLCNVYVKIREKKREMVKKYEEEIALYDGKLDALAGAMKDMLVAAGATSMKTDHGTVYSQVKTRYYPMDWSVFKTWKDWMRILDLSTVVVATRPGQPELSEELPCVHLSMPALPWSSTELRAAAAEGHLDASDPAKSPLHPAVASYISQHHLYQKPS